MGLTAPGFRVHHGHIKVVDFQGCAKLKAYVTTSNNHSLSILLCLHSCNQLVGICNIPKIQNVVGFCSLNTKVSELYDLNTKTEYIMSNPGNKFPLEIYVKGNLLRFRRTSAVRTNRGASSNEQGLICKGIPRCTGQSLWGKVSLHNLSTQDQFNAWKHT